MIYDAVRQTAALRRSVSAWHTLDIPCMCRILGEESNAQDDKVPRANDHYFVYQKIVFFKLYVGHKMHGRSTKCDVLKQALFNYRPLLLKYKGISYTG